MANDPICGMKVDEKKAAGTSTYFRKFLRAHTYATAEDNILYAWPKPWHSEIREKGTFHSSSSSNSRLEGAVKRIWGLVSRGGMRRRIPCT